MESFIEQGVAAVKSGDLEKAKELLKKHLENYPNDENAWLWMSRCLSEPEQKRKCYLTVLNINPENTYAKEGLQRLDNSNPANLVAPNTSPTEGESLKQDRDAEVTKPLTFNYKKVALVLAILLLVFMQIWSYYRINNLEKVVISQQSELTNVESKLNYVTSIAENANRYAHCHGLGCY